MIAIEGVVIEADTYRRRERNAIRTPDVLPPAVEQKVNGLRTLDGAAQAARVTMMLSHARTGLLAAIAAHDLPQIVEFKKKAAAIEEIAKQVRMGKEFQLDAAEFVRRAERGLGVAIREGQDRGEILTPSLHARDDVSSSVKRPTDFAGRDELATAKNGIYAMTDGVSDEDFERALAEAREEENLSRANVVRKARSGSNTDVPQPKSEERKKVRKTAAGRKVMESIVVGIASLEFIVNDTDPAEIDYGAHKADIEGIRQGINAIRAFLTKIEKGNQNHGC